MSEEEKTPAPDRSNLIGIFRLGSMQLLVTLSGDGHMKRPVARVLKVVPPEVLERNPAAGQLFEMEDLYALSKLCRNVVDHSYGLQSVVPQHLVAPADESPPAASPRRKAKAKKTRSRKAAAK